MSVLVVIGVFFFSSPHCTTAWDQRLEYAAPHLVTLHVHTYRYLGTYLYCFIFGRVGTANANGDYLAATLAERFWRQTSIWFLSSVTCTSIEVKTRRPVDLTILEMLPTMRELVAVVVVCVASLLGWSVIQQEQAHKRRTRKQFKLICGTRNEWLPWLRARFRSFKLTNVWVAEGYYKVNRRRLPSQRE